MAEEKLETKTTRRRSTTKAKKTEEVKEEVQPVEEPVKKTTRKKKVEVEEKKEPDVEAVTNETPDVSSEEVEEIEAEIVNDAGKEEQILIKEDESATVTKEVLVNAAKKEQENLKKKLAKAQETSAKEEILDNKLKEAGRAAKKELYDADRDVIPIHDEIEYSSAGLERKQEYLELVQSMRNNTTLEGTVVNIYEYNNEVTAIVKYKNFYRVLIPFDRFTKLSERDKEIIANARKKKQAEKSRKYAIIQKRLNSQVDFICKGIDEEQSIAVGDRFKAMEQIRNNFYLSRNRNGYYINEGQKVEARIVKATANNLTVEVRGIEKTLSAEDISTARIPNVEKEYPVGTTVPVKITSLLRDKTSDGKFTLKAAFSIKEATQDKTKQAFDFLQIGMRSLATVTSIEPYGIFCRIEGPKGSIDALCLIRGTTFVDIPPVNSLISVVITEKNMNKMQITAELSSVLRYADVM